MLGAPVSLSERMNPFDLAEKQGYSTRAASPYCAALSILPSRSAVSARAGWGPTQTPRRARGGECNLAGLGRLTRQLPEGKEPAPERPL
jgi:hypothetical protein